MKEKPFRIKLEKSIAFKNRKYWLQNLISYSILGIIIENEGQSLQTIPKGLNTDNSCLSLTSLSRFLPPTITRLLQSSYRYHPGEQLHFLVEYSSPSVACQSAWEVQHSNDKIAKPIEDGLIVNADCSSILIIESITSQLQGLYTFHVENLYGRAMTQTTVIVNSNDIDNDTHRK